MLNAAHHRLPVETHETQSFLGLLLALAFLAVYARYRTIALGTFLLPLCRRPSSQAPTPTSRP